MTAASRSSCSHLRSRCQITKSVVLRFNIRSLNKGERCVWRDGRTKKPWRVEKRLYHKCEHLLGFSVCLHRSVSISFVRPVSLSFCASACLFSLFSRCAFCPGHIHTHIYIYTHKRVCTSFSHFLVVIICFEIEVVKVARARADPAEDWQRPRHWRSWCTRSGWNRGGTWLDGLFNRLMHKYRPKMAVPRSRITLSYRDNVKWTRYTYYIRHSPSLTLFLSLLIHVLPLLHVPTVHPVLVLADNLCRARDTLLSTVFSIEGFVCFRITRFRTFPRAKSSKISKLLDSGTAGTRRRLSLICIFQNHLTNIHPFDFIIQ